jgi:hypothetical protein
METMLVTTHQAITRLVTSEAYNMNFLLVGPYYHRHRHFITSLPLLANKIITNTKIRINKKIHNYACVSVRVRNLVSDVKGELSIFGTKRAKVIGGWRKLHKGT